MATEPHVRHTAQGTLTLTGPADLLDTPTDAEIRDRIAATSWRTAFDRLGAESDHRLGLIETRFQLNYVCSQPGISGNIISYGIANGVAVRANPRSRRRLRPS
jgi:hypothetical protein